MNIKQVLISARYAVTRDWKAIRKKWLCMVAPSVVVAGYKDQLDRVLRLSNLPKYKDLKVYDDVDSAKPMSTAEPDFSEIHSAAIADATFEATGLAVVRVFL